MEKLLVLISLCITISTSSSTLNGSLLEKSLDVDNTSSLNNILTNNVLEQPLKINYDDDPTAYFDIVKIVQYYGYIIETHKVETSDGYILTLHRITGNSTNPNQNVKPAVFLQHGILSSSIDWVIMGSNHSLGFLLSDAGYDVWLGNARGNSYCRKHKTLSIHSKEFWDFSWHEIGTRDLPAMVDHILENTKHKKLFYIGHSQGTTAFFVMASQLPAYNDKIHVMFALAPIVYSSRMFSPILQYLAQRTKQLELISKLIGLYEFEPTKGFLKKFAHVICTDIAMTQQICLNILFLITGFDKEQINTSKLPSILNHVPAGSSTKQFVHYGQIIKSGNFEQFDFGVLGNMKHYARFRPPSYDLKNVRAPVSLHYSRNDWLSNVKDVEKLYIALPNPIGKFLVNKRMFNHIDYLFAKNANSILYEKILTLMLRFNKG